MKSTECGIGLYSFTSKQVSGMVFKQFYEVVYKILEMLELMPTYINISGIGYSDKSVKIDNKAHKRLLESNFEGISALGFTINPPESNAPAYDGFCTIDFSWSKEINRVSLNFVINESIISLGNEKFKSILDDLVSLWNWDFGCALSMPVKKDIELYLLSGDNGELNADEYKALCLWYAASQEEKKVKLRDVYPYNLLNSQQLSYPLPSGKTLKEYILHNEHSTLNPMPNSSLFLWKIKDGEEEIIRNELKPSNILVSYPA